MRKLTCAAIVLVVGSSFTLTAAGRKQQSPSRPEPDLCAVPPGAQPLLPAKLLPGMGETKHFPVTTKSDDARRFFLQGVSQIHSFWFQESERSCLQAAQYDPGMAMAYWCIALSAGGDYRPAFQLMRDPNDGGRPAGAAAPAPNPEAVTRMTNGSAVDSTIRAREAIAKAMSLRDQATDRERLYIEAQSARRAPGNKDAADAAYIAGMRKLVAAFPDDLDAKSMLALANDKGLDPVTKEPRAHTMEANALLEEIVAKDDDHFGAHHYLIHAWEGSKTPEKAWRANERYPTLVPNIPHALHMPGHIYAQSGKIEEAIASFTVAAENELKWLNADSLYPNGHHGHNVHFLIHALNLGGRYQDSMTWVQHLFTFKETPPEKAGNSQRVPYRQGYFGLIKTLVRFERWPEILDGRTIPMYDKPEQNGWRLWATGLAQAATGQPDRARASLKGMQGQISRATATAEPLRVAALELEATILARSVDPHKNDDRSKTTRAKANEIFGQAAARERAMLYTEPPSYPRPVAEGWANVAQATGDFVTAEREYREALDREPESGRSLLGLAAALEAEGKTAEARQARERGAKAWAKADADLPQLRAARAMTGQ
jgi:tetratricopeptide (TPR) repeat protein